MSCFGHDASDQDLSDDLNGPYEQPNATCSECHEPFVKAREDTGSMCDSCCFDRDQWVIEYQARIARMATAGLVPVGSTTSTNDARDLRRMATAVLAADLTNIKEVA